MCEFHESTCNGFGDIWWTDNPIYFSSIDVSRQRTVLTVISHSATSNMCECLERTRCLTPMGVDVTALSAGYGLLPSANVLSSSRPRVSSKGWVDHICIRLQIPVCFQ